MFVALPGGVEADPLDDPIDPLDIEPWPIELLFLVWPERRAWLRCADDMPPVPVDIELPVPIDEVPCDPVSPIPGVVPVVVGGVAPVLAVPVVLPPGDVICADAAVASRATVIVIMVFKVVLLKSAGGYQVLAQGYRRGRRR